MQAAAVIFSFCAIVLIHASQAAAGSSLRIPYTDDGTLRTCPHIRCRGPPAGCHADDVIHSIVRLSNGRSCKGCPFCKTELPDCENLLCPAFTRPCAKDERSIRQVRSEPNGDQCLGCFVCEEITINPKQECPKIKCQAPPNCANLRNRYFRLEDGTRCKGCPFCLPRDIICLPLPCPNPGFCQTSVINYFDYFGKQCPGCPTPCPFNELLQPTPEKPTCDFACLDCAPPSGYVAPPPDKNGCVPCHPCGGDSLITE